jgi:hypothetical protein
MQDLIGDECAHAAGEKPGAARDFTDGDDATQSANLGH